MRWLATLTLSALGLFAITGGCSTLGVAYQWCGLVEMAAWSIVLLAIVGMWGR